jgi:hypothetical protein
MPVSVVPEHTVTKATLDDSVINQPRKDSVGVIRRILRGAVDGDQNLRVVADGVNGTTAALRA